MSSVCLRAPERERERKRKRERERERERSCPPPLLLSVVFREWTDGLMPAVVLEGDWLCCFFHPLA